MAASVDIVRWTGGVGGSLWATILTNTSSSEYTTLTGAAPHVITGGLTRANAIDLHSGSGDNTTADTTNPVQIPSSGNTNYSFWVSTSLFYNSGLSSTIGNIRWFSGGTNNFGTGIDCWGHKAFAYYPATGTVGQTGTKLTLVNSNHPGLDFEPVAVWPWTVSSPLGQVGMLFNGGVSGSTAKTSRPFGQLFVYQIRVDSTASAGTSTAQTFTFKYDET